MVVLGDISRRHALRLAPGAAATSLLAGCFGSSEDDEPVRAEIESGTEIVFRATNNWTAKAPEAIAGADNPTLVLTEGERYTIGWDEGDGRVHNMELRGSDETYVEDYATPVTPDPGEEQFIEFEALPEIEVYRCNGHGPSHPQGSQEGTIVVE